MNEKDLKETSNASDQDSTTIKVAGKEFKSVEELKQSYEEAQKVIGRQGQKLGEFKKGLVKEIAGSDKADYSQVEQELFDKPVEVFKTFKQNVKQELREELKAEMAEEDAWKGFFAKNKELEPHADKIKNDTYTRLWPSIADKSADEQFEVIAKEWNPFKAKATSQEESVSYEDTDARSTNRSTSQDSSSTSTDSDKPLSMADMISKKFGK